jgi:DNA-damage-inducible protein D
MTKELQIANNKTFESLKHVDENGNEFWLAREMQTTLQYKEWRNFEKVINTAMIACKISRHEIAEHFVETSKIVAMPIKPRKNADTKIGFVEVNKTKNKKVKDFQLSRYACYLIVMNGDPRKKVIADGQTYFAVKTRQQEFQELFERLTEDDKRLFIRGDIRQKNMLLAEAAKNAGIITTLEYATFQDAGYRGLYNGETRFDIAQRKNLEDGEEVLDYMGATELAANLFRITQTEDIMRKNKVSTPKEATQTHYKVGKEVRDTIKRLGGTMPEELPMPDKSIKQIESEKQKQIKDKK